MSGAPTFIVKWLPFGPIWEIVVSDHSDGDIIGTERCEALALTRRGAQRKAHRIARRLADQPRQPAGEIRVP